MNGKKFLEINSALKNLMECIEKKNEIQIYGVKYNCKNIKNVKEMLFKIRNQEMILIGNMYWSAPKFRIHTYYGESRICLL